MTIHEFGTENTEIILLIHPSVVKWDYFENVIPLLEKKYHLLVPALPGYDFDNDSDFTSVEQIASDLNVWMKAQGYTELYAVYGCSMGGSVALLVALGQLIKIKHCVMDGGITPYQLPWYFGIKLQFHQKTALADRQTIHPWICNASVSHLL